MPKKTTILIIILSVLLQFPANFALATADQSIITLEVDTSLPAEEPEEVPPTGGGAGPKPEPEPPIIFNVQVITGEDSAIILWETNEPATTEIEWGQTTDYENGSITAREGDLIIEHQITLENLTPDTEYHFRITALSAAGGLAISDDYSFRTLIVDLTPPANIIDFIAIPGDQRITLEWTNPPDEDFAGVKIMRSTEFFPLTPEQGEEVYNGRGTEYLDKGLENGIRYYYTGFAYDYADNFASGAIVTAFPWPPEEPLPLEIPPIIPPEFPLPPLPPEWPIVPPEFPLIEELTIYDFEFFQKGRQIFPDKEGGIKIIKDEPLEVSIKADKLPFVLKSIIFNIALPDQGTDQSASLVNTLDNRQSASYLLKINPEKTAYQATIIIPKRVGRYDLTLMILNYLEGTITKITGYLIVRRALFTLPFQDVPGIYALLFLIITSILIFLIAFLRSKNKEREKRDLKPLHEQSY